MKKFLSIITALLIVSGCTNLTRQEHMELQILKGQGVTIDKPVGSWEKPANPMQAGILNILPGFGNFYLAAGNSGDSNHYLYGGGNFLLWPLSILWGVPEAVVDANNINKREMLYYYKYDPYGKKEFQKTGLKLTID